jgi:hypothetical protein
LQGLAPPGDAVEEVALSMSHKFSGLDFADVSVIDQAPGYLARLDKVASPLTRERLEIIVVH